MLIGILSALAASALFAVGMGLQTLEARQAPTDSAFRPSLLGRLMRRPRWLAGTGLICLGWLGQAFALTKAPLTLVQPVLGMTLVFLLFVAIYQLDEHVGARETFAALAVAGGVPLLAFTTPARHVTHSHGARLWVTLGVLAVLALIPLGLRGTARSASLLVPVAAGLAYALDSLATKFAADDYTRSLWLGAIGWLVVLGAAGLLGTLGEMSALQSRPVTHVAPLVLALTTFVPVALAPLLAHEWWPHSPLRLVGLVVGLIATGGGAAALARRGVGR